MRMHARPKVGRWRRGSSSPGTIRLAALLVVLALVVAACGGAEEPAEGADNGGTESGGAAAGGDASGEVTDENIELTVWASRDYYVPPDEFASFEEEYPNITINWDVQADDDILQQLQRMKAAGQKMPDVIHDDVFMMEAYVAAGLLRPIDDVLARWEEEEPDLYNSILPITWEETTFDGQPYGMSIGANYDILYYSVPLFESAGVEAPFEDWEQVLDALQAVKDANPDSVPLTVQALQGEGVTMLKNFMSSVGVPFDGAVPDLQSDAAMYVLDWLIRAQEAELLPPEAISWGESEARGAFIRGDAAVIFDGITTAGDFAEVEDFDYETAWNTTPLPTNSGTGLEGQTVTSSRTWAITSDTEYPYEASLVLRYIAETDNLIEPLANGSVPMRQTEALNDPRLTEYLPFFDEELREAYLDAGSVPSGLNGGEVEAVLEQLFGEIVVGTDMTPQELADKYQPELDAL
jgi:multiple sugar transport system substrate-binding protein